MAARHNEQVLVPSLQTLWPHFYYYSVPTRIGPKTNSHPHLGEHNRYFQLCVKLLPQKIWLLQNGVGHNVIVLDQEGCPLHGKLHL